MVTWKTVGKMLPKQLISSWKSCLSAHLKMANLAAGSLFGNDTLLALLVQLQFDKGS